MLVYMDVVFELKRGVGEKEEFFYVTRFGCFGIDDSCRKLIFMWYLDMFLGYGVI